MIHKLFLPLAAPGLASLGLAATSVTSGVFNALQGAAIIVGLLVVAIAGIFTIRSNVAKVWREQAEAEKARNAEQAAENAELRAENKHLAAELATEKGKPDLHTLAELMGVQHHLVLARLDSMETTLLKKEAA